MTQQAKITSVWDFLGTDSTVGQIIVCPGQITVCCSKLAGHFSLGFSEHEFDHELAKLHLEDKLDRSTVCPC